MITPLPVLNNQLPQIAIVRKVEEKPKPVEYKIVSGDTLTSIAVTHNTTVQRLYNKNLNIDNPDVINVDQTLVIPTSDEELADRPLTPKVPSEPIRNVSGGGYTAGYCTAYAWSRRPDLPGNLGNADTWGINAAAQGFTVNDTPSVGAIGVAKEYMHVVYIESVGDGTVYVSEQNYVGFGIVSYRTAPISEFTYIH